MPLPILFMNPSCSGGARPSSFGCPLTATAAVLVWLLAGNAGAGWNPEALVGTDIGGPAAAGSTTHRTGTVEIVAGGTGIGGRSDQFHFASAPESGDFDVRVRVAALEPTDLWAKAGLMARDGADPGAAFAAVVTTPSGAGCAFQSRGAAGGDASYQGSFPANQPFTWLRLQRKGSEITGYAGYDGRRWSVLGTRSLELGPGTVLGLAATSHATPATRAEFRDPGDAVDAVVRSVPADLEPPGPCSRRTGLVITEIMYHPASRADDRNLEFVEVYNSQPYFEDIGGWRLAGDVEFTFPPGTRIPGGGYLLVAAAPADLKAVSGIDGMLGPFEGSLANGGGRLRLLGDRGAVLLDLTYNDRAPWPELADGTGHSLVLLRPSLGEANPGAWGASRVQGGSPGRPEAVEINTGRELRINEWRMPDEAGSGFVELFNAGAEEADLGGLRLGRSPESMTFAIPAGTRLAPGGFVQFGWTQLGFRPDPTGDTLLLGSADGSRFLDLARCRPQVAGTSTGRWPNGGAAVRVLPQPTPGAANARPRPEVVINEIHHHPLSGEGGDEFVELFNPGTSALDLGSWEFDEGISFVFPTGTRIPPGGYLVVARDAARLRLQHPELDGSQVVGDFQGKLTGRGERLVLSRPVTVRKDSGKYETVSAVVAEARYADRDRWNHWSDAGGSSLELVDARADTRFAANWADSDETGRGEWTTVEATGRLDNGPSGGGFPGPGGGGARVQPDSLHLLLMGEGECLVDNVEVLDAGGVNRLANGSFETGLTGWTFSGNHIRSSLSTNGGDGSSQSLHLRASGNGDTGANRIFVKLTQTLRTNTTATLRARVKWLHGWPEVLLRLHGNYLEAPGRLVVSASTGTPGARNSRATDNAGPALDAVTHFPVVPGANEPVRVTAQVDDPDGVASVTLRYRQDPGTELTPVTMRDDGTEGDAVPGDGTYSAWIPAPGAPRLVAYTVEALDRGAAPAKAVYPPGAPARECLVRFGDGTSSGAFGTYRLWVTQANSDVWRNRPVLSNEPVDCTFVYGNARAIPGSGGRFAGSPYHQQFTAGPASDAHFVVEFPGDDRVLGASALNKLHAPGNGAFDDALLQREQTVYWMARKSGLAALHRRFFHFYVNGTRKKTLMEDTQVGSDDLVEEYWPDDTEGNLYKMQPWFEFPDATGQNLQMSSSTFVSLARFTTTGGALKLARYRWNWLVRGAEGTANDFTHVLDLINLVTDTAQPEYHARVEQLVDVDRWLRFFALNHAVGNWDSVGYRNQQNTYAYKPRNGPWELIVWDANIVLGNGSADGPGNLPLFTTGDPTISRWFAAGSPFRRRYLVALHDLVTGPMQVEAVSPMLDAKYAAFQEHGIAAGSPAPIKTWISSARSYILSQINREAAGFAVTSVATGDTLTLTLSGTGPLDLARLDINGAIVEPTWVTTSSWQAVLQPTQPIARLVVTGLDSEGQPLAGASVVLNLAAERRVTLAAEPGSLVFRYPVLRTGSYQLQATADLSVPDWQTIGTTSAPLGTLELRIPVPSAPAFYRIREP